MSLNSDKRSGSMRGIELSCRPELLCQLHDPLLKHGHCMGG
jgi:hypothetical protein